MELEAALVAIETERREWIEYREQSETAFNSTSNLIREKETIISKLERTNKEINSQLTMLQQEVVSLRNEVDTLRAMLEDAQHRAMESGVSHSQEVEDLLRRLRECET